MVRALAQDSILGGLRKRFAKKGAEVVAGNERAFAAGVAVGRRAPAQASPGSSRPSTGPGTAKITVDGNDICAAAAIFAGCQFFGGYPITPSSEVMQFLRREIWKYGGTVLQAEDEIAGDRDGAWAPPSRARRR